MFKLLGCDYSFSRPGGATLKSLGVHFAARYYSTPGNGKNLTAVERDDLTVHGIDIVSVFESTAGRARAGYAAGMADAVSAQRQAIALGQPVDTCIYFAVDFDANSVERQAVSQYFQGVTAYLGRYVPGVYGGLSVIRDQQQRDPRLYLWQTSAWSSGQVAGGIHLYQNNHTFNGLPDLDVDYAYSARYGSWHGGTGPANQPATKDMSGETVVAFEILNNGWGVLAVRGTDGNLYMKLTGMDGRPKKDQLSGELPWLKKFPIDSAPGIATDDGSDLYVVYTQSDLSVQVAHTPDALTTDPVHISDLGGQIVNGPTVKAYPGMIVVTGEGLHNEVYLNVWENGAWSGWLDMHGQAK